MFDIRCELETLQMNELLLTSETRPSKALSLAGGISFLARQNLRATKCATHFPRTITYLSLQRPKRHVSRE